MGQIPEHWKIRKTSGPLLLIGEGVEVTMIMGFHQLRFIQNVFKSPNKRLEMPGIEPVNPSLLGLHHICGEREGENQTDIQTNTCIDLDRQTNRQTDRQIDRHTEKCNRYTQRHCSRLRVFNMRGSSPPHPVRECSGSVVECLT